MPLGLQLEGAGRGGGSRGLGVSGAPALWAGVRTEERGGREKDQGGEEKERGGESVPTGGVPTLLLLPVPEPA